MGGPGERARARQMLEKAALLKGDWVGGSRHAGTIMFGKSPSIPVQAAALANGQLVLQTK